MYYERSLKRELDIGRPDMLIKDYVGMGDAQEGLDRLRDAIVSYAKAVSIVEKLRSGLKKEEHKTGFLSIKLEPYQRLTSALAKLYLEGAKQDNTDLKRYGNNYGDTSFYFAENTKTRTLIEILSRRKGTGMAYKLPLKLAQKEQSIIHQISRINEQLADAFKKDKEVFKKKKEMINTLEAELERFIQDLRKDYSEYATLKSPHPLRLHAVTLSPCELIMEYYLSDTSPYLY